MLPWWGCRTHCSLLATQFPVDLAINARVGPFINLIRSNASNKIRKHEDPISGLGSEGQKLQAALAALPERRMRAWQGFAQLFEDALWLW